VVDYEKKKLALISKLKVWRDHENPAMAAMGERQYWHTWNEQENSEGTEKFNLVKGTGQIDARGEKHAKFARHFDARRDDCPDTSSQCPRGMKIEPWRQQALLLERKFQALMGKAANMNCKTTTFVLRLDKLKSQFPVSIVHKTELKTRLAALDKARLKISTAEAATSSKTEAQAVEKAKILSVAIPTMMAAMKDYEKVLGMVCQYLDLVDN
jgi:hypothetical protein